MDSTPATYSLSPHSPFRYTIAIIHFIVMSAAFIGCYPYALTQQTGQRSQKRRFISLGIGVVLALFGLVTAWFVPYSPTTSSSVSILYFCLTFGLFCFISLEFALEYIGMSPSHHQQQENDRSQQQQLNSKPGCLYLLANRLPKTFRPLLTSVTVCLGYFYIILDIMVLTSTCESMDQCWVPLATGASFVLSGSLALLYLTGILLLPSHSSPEYYEAIWILLWGCLSFFWWDTPIVGSSWKGINFSLLWTTGGLLSLVMSFQTWLPFLQKRNIVNSVIICLTGKGIASGYSEADDAYTMDLQTALGTILLIGSAAKFTHIMLRKTETDTIPRLYSRMFGTHGESCGDDDDTCVNDLDIGRQRSTNYELAYRQLTGTSPSSSCKHQSIYASITMVCGLLSCFATISGGLFFIGTAVEWVHIIQYYISDSTTYVNVLLAMSFLWISYLMILCSVYKYSTASTGGYDYLGVATGEDRDLPISTKLSPSPTSTTFDNHDMATMMSTPTSSSSTTYDPAIHQSPFTSIPLGTLGSASTKHLPPAAPTSNEAAAAALTSSPPIRPSQYRAKRRSLLISTNRQHHDNTSSKRGSRTLSSSSYTGVGGILPDDFFVYGEQYYISSPINSTTSEEPSSTPATHHDDNSQEISQQSHSPTFEQQSWQSMASSSLSSSSPPPPHHVTAISTASSTNNEKAMTHAKGDDGAEQSYWTVQKTEDGKRKQQQ